jgi:proton glutamate symport protein
VKKVLTFLPIALITIAAVVHVVSHYVFAIDGTVLFILRWLAIAGLILYAIRKKSLTTWILVSMVIGAEVGHDFPEVAVKLQVLSQVFLRMIKTIIAPLLFGTLVVGIAGHSGLKQVGRMGLKSIIYFEIVTTVALFIGLAAINISGAGKGIVLTEVHHEEQPQVTTQNFNDIILHIFPENIAKSIAEGQVLQVVVFSIIFGMALALVNPTRRQPMLNFAESLSETMFKFTNIIMYFAPIGVGAALAFTVGHMGLGILKDLLQLLATFYCALLAFLLLVLLPIAVMVRVPLKKFFNVMIEPVSIAFATTTSEAALPRAMEAMEKIGVPRKIVAFVMPTGYSFNLDGSTLYLSLASVFVAKAAHINLSFPQQLMIVFTLMLTSKGVAGVSRASLVILLGTVSSFGLPAEPVYLILGIDALMDMGRTAVNVIGNCLATVVIARWEGEFVDNYSPKDDIEELKSQAY